MSFTAYINDAAKLLNACCGEAMEARIEDAVAAMVQSLARSDPVLVCGNGGSASDAMHIAGELVGRYLKERPPYNVIALASNPSVLTAWSNDYDYDTVFSRQVQAHGKPGGTLIAISTSGNSANVVNALTAAREIGMATIALTGEGGGRCAAHADILIDVPSKATPRIQETHICIYHYLCQRVEEALA